LVFFSHLPGEVWHLERLGAGTRLLPGRSADPDFAFRFTPKSVERLAAVQGGVGSFAVALFSAIADEDPELRVGFRIMAPFTRLVRRGYLGLLVAGGNSVFAFGASRGVRTLRQLRELVIRNRAREPESWEAEPASRQLEKGKE